MNTLDEKKPAHLIINPHSGYGGQRLLLSELRTAMRLADIELVEYTTRGPGDARMYASAVADDASSIIVWGGDGTAHEVVNAVVGRSVPILPCPAGTENLLAKEMRIPRDPRAIARIVKARNIVECDVGHCNGVMFMLIIGVGFDGEAIRRLTAVRSGHISHLSYFWPLWRTFWEHDFPKLRIVADGQEIFNDYGLAFVGNISRYAVGLRICVDARFDDGLLDLVIFNCQQQGSLLLHAAWTLLRMHPLKGNVQYRRIRHAVIEAQTPVPSQIDGEIGPMTPLDISVSPRSVRLLVPPRSMGWGGAFWPWKQEQ